MTTTWNKAKLLLASAVTALALGIVGTTAISPDTARAAGVVLESHPSYGVASATSGQPLRRAG